MLKPPIASVGRAIKIVVRFYVSGTGALLVLGLVLAVALSVAVSTTAGLIALAVAIGLVLPYRLMCLDAARIEAHNQLRRIGAGQRRRGQELEAVNRGLQQVRRDLLGSVAAAREQSDALLRSERHLWTDAVTNTNSLIASSSDESALNLDSAIRRVDEDIESTKQLVLDGLAETRASVEAYVKLRTSNIRLGLARRDAQNRAIDRVLLIVSVQRVGSTLLFDTLRQHPAIEMYPTAAMYERLGIVGRRYPAHLSELDDGAEVEVQAGVGGLVPASGRSESISADGDDRHDRHYAIEKVHPSAIEFDTAGFVNRVEMLRSELGGPDRVRTIYLTRAPVESIRSFVAYRNRDPSWHREVPVEFAHDFYRRSFEAIEAIHQRLPGPVGTYEDLTTDPVSHVAKLLRTLEIEDTDSGARSAAAGMVAAVELSRPRSGSFFSTGDDKPSASSVELGIGSDDAGRAQESIDRCRDINRRLLRASVAAPSATE